MAEEKKEENPFGTYLIGAGAILVLAGFALYLAYTHVYVVSATLMLAIGVLGALSILTFFFGLSLYLARLGQEYRSEGIIIMEWGVAMIFVVVCLGGLLHFVQRFAS